MILISFKSSFSLMEGLHTPSTIVSLAKERGYSSIVIADTNNLYGFANLLRLRSEEGAMVFPGARLRYRTGETKTLLAIPFTDKGFSNLCFIISALNTQQDIRYKEIINLLRYRGEGLFVISTDITTARDLKGHIPYLFFGINRKNSRIYNYLRGDGIKPVLIQDATFFSEEEVFLGILLRAIAQKKRFDDMKQVATGLKDEVLLSAGEIKERFSHINEAFENMEFIESTLQKSQYNFPLLLPGSEIEDSSTKLRELAFEGAKKRYPTITEEIRDRLEYELDVISKKGYSGYFLLVKDIVSQSHLTCGRGSAAASLVSYCLGITNVDPIKHNLMFERFLNPERSDPPDIDIDFAWDERERILRYIFERYKGRVAQVSNHNLFSTRLAIREVARTFGLCESEINKIINKVENIASKDTASDTTHPSQADATIESILSLASRIGSNMRHIATHCGGVIISPKDIREVAPVEITGGGRFVIQWDKDDIEDLKIVKIDILGNRSLAVIRDAYEMIRRNYGIDMDRRRIIFEEDPLTLRLIREGKTMGVFYIESPAMRQLQRKTGVADFEHIVIHSSIIRPAANRYINEYVERLKGKPYKPLHPSLSELLSETYGIMCYQEDVMKVAIEVAGFTLEEADQLRKTLSRKNRSTRLQYYKDKFIAGGIKRGVDEAVLKEIWEMIESFGGYSFCKPHSASYAQVSFMSAYIKAHFPSEFMASVIRNKGGYYSVFAYISEARRMGLRVNPPDINVSESGATGCGDSIWLGFEDIISLKQDAICTIVREREKRGPYRSLEDFLMRNPSIEFSDLRRVILSGAFDRIEGIDNRKRLLLRAEIFKKGKAGSLIKTTDPDGKNLPPYSKEELIRFEQEIFGFPLSIHPLTMIKGQLPADRILAKEIDRYRGKSIKIAGILITEKQILTRKGEMMEFLTFEDETDIFEVVLFPEAFKKNRALLTRSIPFVIYGRVEDDHGAVYLNCTRIEPIRSSTGLVSKL